MTLGSVESDLPDQLGAVDMLIQKAEQANDVAAWASYLMQADAAAEKLESTNRVVVVAFVVSASAALNCIINTTGFKTKRIISTIFYS